MKLTEKQCGIIDGLHRATITLPEPSPTDNVAMVSFVIEVTAGGTEITGEQWMMRPPQGWLGFLNTTKIL